MSHEGQGWQRWHALQIVSQLPEETKEALAILEYAKEILETFIIQGGSNGVAELSCRLALEARSSHQTRPRYFPDKVSKN